MTSDDYDNRSGGLTAASFKTIPDFSGAADPCFGAPRCWAMLAIRDGGEYIGAPTPLQLVLRINQYIRQDWVWNHEPENIEYNRALANEILLGTRRYSICENNDPYTASGWKIGDIWYE